MKKPPGKTDKDYVAGSGLVRRTLSAFYWMNESLQNLQHEKGWPRSSHTQSALMLAVGEGVTRPTDLANLLGISRQAVHKASMEMVKKGLLSIKDDPDDKRSKIVTINPKATAMRDAAVETVREVEEHLKRQLGAHTFRIMVKGLNADWGAPLRGSAASKSSSRTKRKAKRSK